MPDGVPFGPRQFRILYRDFLFRIVDLELLASRGEAQRLLAQFAALLAAFSLTFSIYSVSYTHLDVYKRQS